MWLCPDLWKRGTNNGLGQLVNKTLATQQAANSEILAWRPFDFCKPRKSSGFFFLLNLTKLLFLELLRHLDLSFGSYCRNCLQILYCLWSDIFLFWNTPPSDSQGKERPRPQPPSSSKAWPNVRMCVCFFQNWQWCRDLLVPLIFIFFLFTSSRQCMWDSQGRTKRDWPRVTE